MENAHQGPAASSLGTPHPGAHAHGAGGPIAGADERRDVFPAGAPPHDGFPEVVRLEPRTGVSPTTKPPVRIFLGTEDAQHRAERVFFYSIERHRDPARTYEIFLMKNLAGFDTRRWRTNFTNYRFAIPDFAGRTGRAIYNDVDQIYLADPAELFDQDLGHHGYLAVSAEDTSVMLIDCARMAQWWNIEEARSRDKQELLAVAASQPGLWGAIGGEWNARDLEYVEGRSKCVHFTALHTQPWQPTPDQYSYHRHPLADVWDRLERSADAERYQVFGPQRPSARFCRAAGAELGAAAANAAAPLPLGAHAWLEGLAPRRVIRCSFGRADAGTAIAVGSTADHDVAARPALGHHKADVVTALGLLERVPLDDLPWVLDELFAHATAGVYAAVSCRAAATAPAGTLHSPEWWRAQMADAARRTPGAAWRLDVLSPQTDKPLATYEAPGAHATTTPRVWVLLGSKRGDNRQLTTLADALGWPYETKQLAFNSLRHLPSLLLDASLATLDAAASQTLAPPWPDLVIAAGKRSVPVARWIRAQSGGATRLVHVGRPWAPLAWFDLIITTPQYALPARPNVLHNTMPLDRMTPERRARAAADAFWRDRIDDLPEPRVAVLVGGNSTSHVLTAGRARELAEAASRLANRDGGSLLVVTGPRTPEVAVETLRRALTAPALLSVFESRGAPNAYDTFVARADAFVVTGDSASMMAEACSTGKPVHIFELPRRSELVPGLRTITGLLRSARGGRVTYRGTPKQQDALGRFYDRLVENGLVTPARDLEAYYRALEVRGLAARMDTDREPISPTGPDDLERAVERVREVLRADRRVPA